MPSNKDQEYHWLQLHKKKLNDDKFDGSKKIYENQYEMCIML